MPLQEAFLFNLALSAGLILLLRGTSNRARWVRVPAVLGLVGSNLAYLGWRGGVTLPGLAASPAALWPWVFWG